MTRRFLQSTVEALEAAFDRQGSDGHFLRDLLEELAHRSTPRARDLEARALAALDAADAPGASHGQTASLAPEASVAGRPRKTQAEACIPDALVALSVRLDREPLSARAEALLDAHRVRHLGGLVALVPHELQREPNVGRKTVAELGERLTRYGLSFGSPVAGWSPDLAEELGPEAEAWAAARDPAPAEARAADLPGALRERLLRAGASARNADLVARYLGWDGAGGATLEETARPYGMTRERVRQISKKLTDRLASQPAPAPLLDVLDALAAAAPLDTAELGARLQGARLLPAAFHLKGVRTAAEVFELAFPYELVLGDRVLVGEGGRERLAEAARTARKLAGRRGCLHIADFPELEGVLGRTGRVTQVAVEALDFEWLSRDGWFWRGDRAVDGRNRLVNTIALAMAAAGSLDIGELRAAVRRPHRMQGFAPPTAVLLEICRRLPFLTVEGRRVTARLTAAEIAGVVTGMNATLLDILRRHGPVLDRLAFLELALARGLNENSFNIFMTYSPVIWRPANGLYAAIGAELPPGTIEAYRPAADTPTRVIASGWSQGRVRIAWRLQRGVVFSGVLTIPSGFAPALQGRYQLVDVGGRELGGVGVNGATVWRLRAAFRRLGADAGDVLELVFDPVRRLCRARVGDLEQIEAEPARLAEEADDDDE